MTEDNLNKVFDFLHQIEALKSTLRYCVTKTGRQESTAEHSWRLALTTFIVAKELKLDLDVSHAVKVALVHDIAESITGDIDYIKIQRGEVTKEEKQKLEIEAINKLQTLLPNELGKEIYELWREYEDSLTKEARFIKALDKIETLTQLVESGYKTYDNIDLIANYADNAVKNFPELANMLKILKQKLKKEYEKGNFPWKEEYD